MRFLNNSKQANLFNNNIISAQLQDCYIIYFEKNEKLQKKIEYKIKIYTRKSAKTSYKNIQNNIDKNITSKNQYNVNKYLFKQINTKIDNKYKVAYCKRCYNKSDTIYLQQFNL